MKAASLAQSEGYCIVTFVAPQDIGMIVDNFSLTAITGEAASLQTFLRGRKGAVVVFWSGVCSHCVRYDGYLNGFAKQHPNLGLVAIASRQGETPDQLRARARDRGLVFPILHDPGGRIARQWSTQQTPRVFLIDANRVLCYRGAIDNYKYPDDIEYAAYLEPVIKQFLSGEPLSRTETASYGCAIESVYYNFPKAL
jgi:peroxiredoxin